MSRHYFNGVSNVSYNGHLISFSFTDLYRGADSIDKKEKVVDLVSDLDTVEGVCRFLLGEIEKVKKSGIPPNFLIAQDEPEKHNHSHDAFKVGLKLSVTKSEHNEE